MADWADIRRRVLVEGVSKRQILRETGMHWLTLKKILTHPEPPGYRQRQARPKQKLAAFQARLEQILKEDQVLPRKQRHTAKRVWERLKEAGFTGGRHRGAHQTQGFAHDQVQLHRLALLLLPAAEGQNLPDQIARARRLALRMESR